MVKLESISASAKQAVRHVRIGYRLAIIFSMKVVSYIVALYVLVLVFGANAIHRLAHRAEVELQGVEDVSLFLRIEIAFIISVVFFILRTAIVEMMEKEIQEIEEKK
jgi:hypothetical protein